MNIIGNDCYNRPHVFVTMFQCVSSIVTIDPSLCLKGSFKCYVTQMGGVRFYKKKALRRCKVQCYLRYEGVGGGPISTQKKRYVILEWPLTIDPQGGVICNSCPAPPQ